MRVESNKPCKNGGWLHRLDNPLPKNRIPNRKKEKPQPQKDFTMLAQKYYTNLQSRQPLADKLGVSADSLDRLRVGWDGKCYTFPMRDGYGKIIGIRLRRPKGGKYAVTGSKNGIFIPAGVKADTTGLLLISEGPTDCAALLDLGFDTISRASCNTGAEYIKTMIGPFNRTVVIVADKDKPTELPNGRVSYPGYEGGIRLAKELKSCTQSIRVVKPPKYKDIREWYRNGATAAMVLTLVGNARFC